MEPKKCMMAVFLIVIPAVFMTGVEANGLYLQVSGDDSINAGDTATVIGRIYDQNASYLPALGDSIRWKLVPSTAHPGDMLLVSQGDTTKFICKQGYHTVGVIGTYSDTLYPCVLIDTFLIFIQPICHPPRIDIVLETNAAQTDKQIINWIFTSPYLVDTVPCLTIIVGSPQTSVYVYAVQRDISGNFVTLANQAAWVSLSPGIVTVSTIDGKGYECIVSIAPGVSSGAAKIVAFLPDGESDSALIKIASVHSDGDRIPASPWHDRWRVRSNSGVVRIIPPASGMHRIKAYTLAGIVAYSRMTREREPRFALPSGAYIMKMETVGNGRVSCKKIIVQ